MYRRTFSFTLLFLILLAFIASPAWAQEPQPDEPVTPQLSEAASLSPYAPSAITAATTKRWNVNYISHQTLTPEAVGAYTSLVYDASNHAWISYYDETNKNLMVAHYAGVGATGGNCGAQNTWICETIDSAGDVGLYTSIALYENENLALLNKIGISYYDKTNGALKFAERSCKIDPGTFNITCSWKTETVFTAAGLYTSMKYDQDGRAHIAHYYQGSIILPGALDYAHEVDAGTGSCPTSATEKNWKCDVIDMGATSDGVGLHPSLDISLNDITYITYYDSEAGNLKMAWYMPGGGGNCGPSGNTWNCKTIDDSVNNVGLFSSLDMPEVSGEPVYIAYLDQSAGKIKLAKSVDSNGNCGLANNYYCEALFDTILATSQLGLALDYGEASGLHIAYQDVPAGPGPDTLELASYVLLGGNCGPTYTIPIPPFSITTKAWSCQTIDPAPEPTYTSEANYISMAHTSTGLVGVAYFELDSYYDNNLKFADQSLFGFLPMAHK